MAFSNEELILVWRTYDKELDLSSRMSFWQFRHFVMSAIGKEDVNPRYKGSLYHQKLMDLAQEAVSRYRESMLTTING